MDKIEVKKERGRPRFNLHHKLSFWLFLLFIILCVSLSLKFIKVKQTTMPQGVAVVLAPVTVSDVPVYLTALGTVTPTYSVRVRTQINGQLMRVLFTEGQLVKAGDVLAEVDPRLYEAQLMQYQGQLARDQALLANAKIDLERYAVLVKKNAVTQQTYATQGALVKQYEGNIKTDQGLIEGIKVNLIYSKITSPVDGRVGLRLVDAGNFVQTTDTDGIAIINTLNPITVIFTLAEDNIPELVQSIYQGKKFTVEAYDRQQLKRLATGTLATMDNQIDTSTGTVKFRANFANDENALFPNQFVNVRLLVKTLPHMLRVPTAAIQYGNQGAFVYVFDEKNNVVKSKPVKVSVDDGENTAITSGVTLGQQVVVMGGDNLTDGASVTVSTVKRDAV